MKIKRLTLVNFKNHQSREFEFNKKIVCITGSNGVGKTNILDALYYLSFSKSFINAADNLNILNGEEFFTVRGVYEIDGMEENIVLSFHRQKGKTLKRNDKEYEKISDHIGLIPLVIISPQDIRLIFDGSSERRRFVDSAVAQNDSAFLAALQNYNRALMQRNKYLKSSDTVFDPTMLLMWDMHLISNAKKLYEGRRAFIDAFTPEFQKYYKSISNGNEVPDLKYFSQLENSDMETLLRQSVDKDRILQYTSCGVHKDDLIFEINSLALKNCGSQGQQKSFLVSLKFAQYEIMKRRYGFPPILLLDDVFDKLDMGRISNLLGMVALGNSGISEPVCLLMYESLLPSVPTITRPLPSFSRRAPFIAYLDSSSLTAKMT